MTADISLEHQVALMSEDEQQAVLSDLDLEGLLYEWSWFGRPSQILPLEDPWQTALVLAGRGFGKTLCGNQTVRDLDRKWAQMGRDPGQNLRIGYLGRTAADVRDTMLEGPSGLLHIYPPSEQDRVIWTPSRRKVTLPGGAIITCFSAEEPDQLRGPQMHFAWCDELAAFKHKTGVGDLTAWQNLRIATRLGMHPQVLVTTTPKRVPPLRELLKEQQGDPGRFLIRRGKTTDNVHLSDAYIDLMMGLYAGTTLGQQELEGVMLDDVEGAMTSEQVIEQHRVMGLPPDIENWIKVVAVDPSSAENPTDECGIMVIYAPNTRPVTERHAFIVEDLSLRGSPSTWGKVVVEAAERHGAVVVAETNQGGAMIKSVLKECATEAGVPVPQYREVWSAKAKAVRAEVVGVAYERGRVHHVNYLQDYEDQATSWTPEDKSYSPDRLDACLVEGTLVATAYGDVPIENLKKGDRVWTREGLRPVRDAWLTRKNAEVFRVVTEQGSFVATAEHKIFTDRGWQRLDALVQGDNLRGWTSGRLLSGADDRGAGTQRLKNDTAGSTTGRTAGTESRYTSPFGGTITTEKKSDREMSSTILTESPSTTILRTLFGSRTPSTTRRTGFLGISTHGTLQNGKNTSRVSGSLLRNGTEVQKVESGTENTASEPGMGANTEQLRASGAVRSSARAEAVHGTVLDPASTPGTTLVTPEDSSARYAMSLSKSRNDELKPAVESVALLYVEPAGISDVWDVEVEEVHEFFADGHLVHNCVHGVTAVLFPEGLTKSIPAAGGASVTAYTGPMNLKRQVNTRRMPGERRSLSTLRGLGGRSGAMREANRGRI